MAFQIKKDLHFGTGIYLELLDDLTNAKVKTDHFDNTKYTIPIKHIGNDQTEGGGLKWFQDKDTQEWVILKDGKSTDMEISEALYKQLVNYDKGSKVQVTMKDIEGKIGKFTGYDVKPLNGVASGKTVKEDTDKPVRIVSNGSYGITWGMCMNNATQICINRWSIDGINKEVSIANQIEDIAGNLMNVAVDGLKRWEENRHQKDQNSTPNDDDLPF
tara:strand:- start:44 stop:691 length:648 start_codon:yes stop_codon:yes gene_type:complete